MTLPLRTVATLVLAAAVLALASAFALQHLAGLQPCVLCVWQRYPYGVVIVLAALVLILPGQARWLLLAAGLAFLADAGIAGFHVGVEQHWWEGTASCGTGGNAATSLADLKATLAAGPVPRCDEPQGVVLGISLAGWNGLFALAMATFTLGSVLRGGRARP
ncbi:MAG: disulfide bond formation protein B [Rhodospirillaceae bacterium]|jgi:disulfide bond formation protein DsbB|nr:disulfide bond formation protein B [Rhodospirillaceae bacterium]MBT6117125.1 disulfide bond formation protein B [Rhodospirillaceae bacterium]